MGLSKERAYANNLQILELRVKITQSIRDIEQNVCENVNERFGKICWIAQEAETGTFQILYSAVRNCQLVFVAALFQYTFTRFKVLLLP